MRHNKSRYQLNRFSSWRAATLKSMARNLLLRQSIKTTKVKAKATQPLVEKLITMAKQGSLSAKRRAFSVLQDHALVNLLFNDIGKRFAGRAGGYTRTIFLGKRRGDNAEMVIFELTEIKKKETKKHKKEKPAAKEAAQEEKPQEQEKKTASDIAIKERPREAKQPKKKFLGGIRKIFKKERDSL